MLIQQADEVGMTSRLEMAERIRAFGPELRGVFALSDLRNVLQARSKDIRYAAIKDLLKAGVLFRFSRGFYVTEGFDPLVLSQRICPASYVSFGNILARNLLIGSVPKYRVRAAKPGPSRSYDNGQYRIEHFRLNRTLCFGVDVIDGVRLASPEKAVLDTLYFYRQGTRFSFDVYGDIDYGLLDKAKLAGFLAAYRNPVFVEFARRITDA
jgi:hypothetical protein